MEGVHTVGFQIIDCRSQSHGSAGIDRACFEFVGQFRIDCIVAGNGFDHFPAGEERRHFFQQFLLAVQHADPHGSQHLVAGKCHKIHVSFCTSMGI